MITTYLEQAHHLQAVVSIVDAEVGPTPETSARSTTSRRPSGAVLVVATKIDRLPKAQRKPRLHGLAEQLSLPREAVLAFSSTEKLGVDEVWEALLDTFAPA